MANRNKRAAIERAKKEKLRLKTELLTLNEAYVLGVPFSEESLAFVEEVSKKVYEHYTKEELDNLLNDGISFTGVGKKCFKFQPALKAWIHPMDLRDFNKMNNLIGEGTKRTYEYKLGIRKKPRKRKVKTCLKKIANQSTFNAHRSIKYAKGDLYPTPGDISQALIQFLNLPKSTRIYECAAGKGHLSKALSLNGYNQVTSTDLEKYGFCTSGIDFLKSDYTDYDWLITFPPQSLAEEFIRKAFKNRKPFAMLLKGSYWFASTRRELFLRTRPSYILPNTFRANFLLDEKDAQKSSVDTIWVVWTEDSFVNRDQPFSTEFYPLARPKNYPRFKPDGSLFEPFTPTIRIN